MTLLSYYTSELLSYSWFIYTRKIPEYEFSLLLKDYCCELAHDFQKEVVGIPTPILITMTLFGNMVIVDVIKSSKAIVNKYGT